MRTGACSSNWHGYKHIDIMLAISAIAVLALTVAIIFVARGTTLGLLELAYCGQELERKGRMGRGCISMKPDMRLRCSKNP
jgi:hypothetical protein